MLEGDVGAGTSNWIGVLPIFARPKRVQLSIGAVKNILLPGGSLRRFGLLVGSSIVE